MEEITCWFKNRGDVLPLYDWKNDAVHAAVSHMARWCEIKDGIDGDYIDMWLDQYAPWLTDAARYRLLAAKPCFFRADTLARKLGVTFTDRQFFGFRTIGACDIEHEQRDAAVERKRRARKELRRRRRNGKQPRQQWLAENSISREQPWRALGMSRAAYYRMLRRMRQVRATGRKSAASQPTRRLQK